MKRTLTQSGLFSPRAALVALGLLGLTALSQTAQAQTLIYNNGTFATTLPHGVTGSSLADDFVFRSSQTFDQARVWLTDFSTPNDTLNNFSGTLSWLIYDNNAGVPGTVLAWGVVSGAAITLTDTGVNTTALVVGFTYRIFQADFSIPSQTLGAGTYWFRIKENVLAEPFDGSEVYWLSSGASTGFQTKKGNTLVNPITWDNISNTRNRAFQFYSAAIVAAPEPGSLLFVALGGTLVLVKRARRTRSEKNDQ